MPKLYFYYGVMGCGKTALAIMKAHEFKSKGRKVAVIKPSLDTRSRGNLIDSRVGISCECKEIFPNQTVAEVLSRGVYYDLLIADEAQFLTEAQIREIKQLGNVKLAILYGLKNNYKGRLFPGSKAALEIADTIREIPCRCFYCDSKATQNGRFVGEKLTTSGDEIDIGGDEKYRPLCFECFERLRGISERNLPSAFDIMLKRF